MNEICSQAETFLTEIIADLQFDLSVSSEWTDEGCALESERRGFFSFCWRKTARCSTLSKLYCFRFTVAISTASIVSSATPKVFAGRAKPNCRRWRGFAADHVRKNSRPFTFGVLNSTERRVIHLVLQKESDLLTESIGDGRERRLQVRLK
jgi:hypothetical protein